MIAAIIGLSPLHAYALMRLAESIDKLEVCIADSLQDLPQRASGYDIYVVSPDVFIANIDWFMPRRSSVTIFLTSRQEAPQQMGMNAIYDDDTTDEIVNKLRRMVNGLKKDDTKRNNTRSDDLSQREIEVIREVASGKTNKEIAEALCISVNTVITHRKNISAKLGIRSASGISVYAIMNGLLDNM